MNIPLYFFFWQKTIDKSSISWMIVFLVALKSSEWNVILLLFFLDII